MEVSGKKDVTDKRHPLVMTCTPCERDGFHQKATGFCQSCQDHLCQSCCIRHKRNKYTSTHIVVDSNDMPKVKQDYKPKKPMDCSIYCSNHDDKVLEFFCQKHKVVVCKDCVTKEHNSCPVDYIPDATDDFLKSSNYEARIRRMTSISNYCQETKGRVKDGESNLSLSMENTMNDIDLFCDEIISKVTNWKAEMKRQVNEVKETYKKTGAEIVNLCSNVDKGIECIQSQVDQLEASKQHHRLLITVLQADKEIDEFESELNEMQQKGLVTTTELSLNETTKYLLHSEFRLGTINKTTRNAKGYVHPSEGRLSFETKISVETKEDKERIWISAMKMLSPYNMILVDHLNDCIKVLDTSTSTITSRLVMSAMPWDVAVLPDRRQVAVTLTNVKAIQFVVTDGGLFPLRKMDVDGYCEGIAYDREQLVVTYSNPGKYQILNLKGEVLFTSYPVINLSRYPRYVAICKKDRHILISDGDNNRVIKLSWDGRVEAEYTDARLQDPKAVVLLDDDSFYVCSRDTHTIRRVSAKNRQMAVEVKEEMIKEPFGLCVDGDGRFYFGTFPERGTKVPNGLQVFRFK